MFSVKKKRLKKGLWALTLLSQNSNIEKIRTEHWQGGTTGAGLSAHQAWPLSTLLLSVAYRESQALQLPETQAEEERRIAAEEEKKQDELKRIARTGRGRRGRHIKVSLHCSGAMWMSKAFCAVWKK